MRRIWSGWTFIGIISPLLPWAGICTLPILILSLVFSCSICQMWTESALVSKSYNSVNMSKDNCARVITTGEAKMIKTIQPLHDAPGNKLIFKFSLDLRQKSEKPRESCGLANLAWLSTWILKKMIEQLEKKKKFSSSYSEKYRKPQQLIAH